MVGGGYCNSTHRYRIGGDMTNTPSFSVNIYRFKISSESSSISSIPFIENV